MKANNFMTDNAKAMAAYHRAVTKLTGYGENNLAWMDVIRKALSQTAQPVDVEEILQLTAGLYVSWFNSEEATPKDWDNFALGIQKLDAMHKSQGHLQDDSAVVEEPDVDLEAVFQTVVNTVRNYRCHYSVFDDDETQPYPLIDALSGSDKTVSTGIKEAEMLADEINGEIKRLLSPQPPDSKEQD